MIICDKQKNTVQQKIFFLDLYYMPYILSALICLNKILMCQKQKTLIMATCFGVS